MTTMAPPPAAMPDNDARPISSRAPVEHARLLYGLQYLRAAAAMAVVAFHAINRAVGGFTIGEAGVDVFFVLSGVLMVAITADQTRPGAFLLARLRRIAPPYWMVTTIVLAGALLGTFPAMKVEAWHTLASYSFLPARSPSTGDIWPLLVPGWTLNYEMMFYAVFAALLPFGTEIRRLRLLTVIFVGLAAIGMFLQPSHVVLRSYTNPIILEFLAGAWLGHAWKYPNSWPRLIGWPTLAIGATMLIVAGQLHTDAMRYALFGLPAAVIVGSVLGIERRAPIRLHAIPLLLGNASFSIYLWHTLAISIVLKVAEKLHLPPAIAAAGGIAGGIALGLIAYGLMERPLLRYFARSRQVPPTAAPA